MFSRVLRHTKKIAFNPKGLLKTYPKGLLRRPQGTYPKGLLKTYPNTRSIVTASSGPKPFSEAFGKPVLTEKGKEKLAHIKQFLGIKPTSLGKSEKDPNENKESKKLPFWDIKSITLCTAAVGIMLFVYRKYRREYGLISYEKKDYTTDFYTEKGTTLNGVKHGWCTRFYYSGDVRSSLYFEHGKPHGIYCSYFDRQGVQKPTRMRSEKTYEHGKLSGTATRYNENSYTTADECSYIVVNGTSKLHGVHTAYYDNGRIKSKAEYSYGYLIGVSSTYSNTTCNSLLTVTDQNMGSSILIAQFDETGKNKMVTRPDVKACDSNVKIITDAAGFVSMTTK